MGNGYKPVLIRLDQYRRLDGIARRLGVSVGQLVRAIIEAYIESLDERIDYNYYFKLLEENPAKAEEYYNQFCPVCGYKRFEIALQEKLEILKKGTLSSKSIYTKPENDDK